MKSPSFAALMSAALPGFGQAYAGRYRDGFRHLLFNGLFGLWLYHLFDTESYAGAYLVTAVELPFYFGNIVGAKRAAARRNEAVRSRYLQRAIEASRSRAEPGAR